MMDGLVTGGKLDSSVEILCGVVARFKGYCAMVPSLKAQGVVTMPTG